MVVNPPTKQLNRESTLAHQRSGKIVSKSFNDGLKAFGFYGENYIIEAEEREVIKHHHLKASKETI